MTTAITSRQLLNADKPRVNVRVASQRVGELQRLKRMNAQLRRRLLEQEEEMRLQRSAFQFERVAHDKVQRESDGRFRALISALDELVLVFDNGGRCTGVFGGGAGLPTDPDSWVGHSLSRLQGEAAYAIFIGHLRAVLGGESRACEFQSTIRGGMRLLVRLSPMRNRDGSIGGALCLLRDVTEQRRLEREIIEISSSEQERIGQDLHDDLGQQLTGIALMMRSMARKANTGQVADPTAMEVVLKLLNQAIGHTRALAKGLSAVDLAEDGFQNALREMAGGVASYGNIPCKFEWIGDVTSLDADRARHLYRIAQEAINNALKHSGAAFLCLQVRVEGGVLEMAVEDDGCGLPSETGECGEPAESGISGGMGMRVMALRARVIGGQLSVRVRPEGGTSVSCRLEICPAGVHRERS